MRSPIHRATTRGPRPRPGSDSGPGGSSRHHRRRRSQRSRRRWCADRPRPDRRRTRSGDRRGTMPARRPARDSGSHRAGPIRRPPSRRCPGLHRARTRTRSVRPRTIAVSSPAPCSASGARRRSHPQRPCRCRARRGGRRSTRCARRPATRRGPPRRDRAGAAIPGRYRSRPPRRAIDRRSIRTRSWIRPATTRGFAPPTSGASSTGVEPGTFDQEQLADSRRAAATTRRVPSGDQYG